MTLLYTSMNAIHNGVAVGSYGIKCLNFMVENYPDLVREMNAKGTLLAVAQSVDDTAWEYSDLLDTQYAKMYPRPIEFEKVVAWERTRQFYTDGEVMRDKVLVPRTVA